MAQPWTERMSKHARRLAILGCFLWVACATGNSASIGSLDKDVVRAVILSHFPEVRTCYETELSSKAGLEGRIACQFTIAANGKVITSVLQSSTMKNEKVEDCVLREIRKWEFPKPLGVGIVIVSYPFTFIAGQ